MAIAFSRMEPVRKTSERTMDDKLDYIGRRGRYAQHGGLVAGPITIRPAEAPPQYRDERTLWSHAEKAERRGGVIALEVVMALPSFATMPSDSAKHFCRSVADDLSQEHGIVVTYAIHSDALEPEHEEDDQALVLPEAIVPKENNHVHFLLGSRTLSSMGFGACRYRGLLADTGGSTMREKSVGRLCHVVDAADFRGMMQVRLERHLARCGHSIRLRLPAIHPGYHVGPVAAVGALVNDVEAIARRPDAAAIFRKIDRLRVNSILHERNVRSVTAIEPLIGHLSERMFTRGDVEAIVQRFCTDPWQAARIVDTVVARSLTICGRSDGAPSGFHVMPRYRDLESSISQLGSDLAGDSHWGELPGDLNGAELAEAVGKAPRLILLDVTSHDRADLLAGLARDLSANGTNVVMATHLHKRRENPEGIPLRALHWNGDLVVPQNATVLVDEADRLSLSQLQKLLQGAIACGAQLLLCRRSYRTDHLANPTISAVCGERKIALGSGPRMDHDLPFQLRENQTVAFAEDFAGLANLTLSIDKSARQRGRKPFFLCSDPIVAQRVTDLARTQKRSINIGSVVPVEHNDPVVVLLSGPVRGEHLAAISSLRPHFLLTRSAAPNLQVLLEQLRLSLGQVTTLLEHARPTSMVRTETMPDHMYIDLEDEPQPSHDRDDERIPSWPSHASLAEGLLSEVGIEPDDIEQSFDRLDPDDDAVGRDEASSDFKFDDDVTPDDTS
ncbi:MAG TPA: MobA/MobL family protein [Devosia sp.]|jgi:hypothetical protein|uniref:MobA/MobL family protein n=1 Tax=Devosia sp. TaxID=1871048 RepID=UPI002F949AA8